MKINNRVLSFLLASFGFFVQYGFASDPLKPEYKQNLSDAEKICGLAEFWKEASYNFAYFDHTPDLDWDAAFREYVPKVIATKSTKEYYRVMMKFAALLKDGHTGVYPPKELMGPDQYDRAPISARPIGRQVFVTNVEKRLLDTVPLGSEILAVDGIPTQTYLLEQVIPFVSSSTEHALWEAAVIGWAPLGFGLAVGEPGSEVIFSIRTSAGEKRNVRMTRDAEKRAAAGQLEMMTEDSLMPKTLLDNRWLEQGVLYVALNSFGDGQIVDRFKNQVVPELAKAKGVILDIRRNGGGNTPYATAILDYFVDQPLRGPAWTTREHVATYKAWASIGDANYARYGKGAVWKENEYMEFKPSSVPKFLGPVVVLISCYTGSAAEDFVIFVDGLANFTTVGEPTWGSTGQPLMFQLTGGGGARICTKRNTYPDGRDFVGYGVQPKTPVARTLPALLGKEDQILAKGLEVLKKMLSAR
jgi:carboxyl-terminal processing protease